MEFEESDYQNGIETVRDAHDDILDNSLNNEMRTNTSQSEEHCEIISMARVQSENVHTSANARP